MTEELKEQIHERVYNIKVPTLGFSRRDLFNIAMEYAEPREKRIEELEKKAKNAWDENVRLVVNLRNEIESLKKENAELKEELNYAKTHCLFHSDCPTQKELASIKLKVEALSGDIPWSELKDKSDVIRKLTKAKELLKEFNLVLKERGLYHNGLYKRTEQFLNSEVEK